MISFTDYCAPFLIVLGIVGALVFGFVGALIGCSFAMLFGIFFWNRARRKEAAMEWVRLFCPKCGEITGSVGRGYIGKMVEMTCRNNCNGRKYTVEIREKDFRPKEK